MLQVNPVCAFRDNYIWLLGRPGEREVAIVDPGDAAPVLDALTTQGLSPVAILITHHHGDHVGGVSALLDAYPGLPVVGPNHERIPDRTQGVGDGSQVEIPKTGLVFEVLEVPGHTAGHVAYLGHGALFCGDTLFSVGCGRLFEGTPIQMHASLRRFAALPPETLVYCAHEYTLDNIGFAKWVEPDNPALSARERAVFELTDRDQPSVPSTLALELATNPFLRTQVPAVVAAAERYAGRRLAQGHEVFGTLRSWKDREYD
jgi:hydroxyacylglutathione hydrolase